MIFDTKIAGIPCQCQVTLCRNVFHVSGDTHTFSISPDTGEFDFRILDKEGSPAPWLEANLAPEDPARLLEEFHLEVLGERYGYL